MSTTIHSEFRAAIDETVLGEIVSLEGDRFYVIRNVDQMAPFFVSVISSADHWLFISSTGGLTAGRISPKTMLFPYITVDKIHESTAHTGSKSLFRIKQDDQQHLWEPFAPIKDDRFTCTRNIYKNLLSNKLCLEEINHDLQLVFRYTWLTSDAHGFVRECTLENLGDNSIEVELLDGLQNILPAGTPSFAQTNSSNLVDAYKWSELDAPTGLAMFALYSGINDKAEPSESLKANTVYCLGLENPTYLISSKQLGDFRSGSPIQQESLRRGIRGAYFVSTTLQLAPSAQHSWSIIADIEQSQSDVVRLRNELREESTTLKTIQSTIESGSEKLASIIAAADGFQVTAEEHESAHHYANVLFNVLRGGIFDDQYQIHANDFIKTVTHFNKSVSLRNNEFLSKLPTQIGLSKLRSMIRENGDRQLERLYYDYLPITFGRRHGDPSRPWNKFAIRLKDENGDRLISYEGNWRDIFQNWEALALSYPEFIENIIAKFVNASTMDGYNPYRITKDGIDWEVEDPDDPWSYIGYWGDHQVIYLQKLLELSNNIHPSRLTELLYEPIFSYANVPYRIKQFVDLVADPKNTVTFDNEVAAQIEQRVDTNGADGKLVIDDHGEVYQVNLIEKLLVALLAKLGNLVIDGGIWLNTQRPEWNDANNALVGQGVSMVTLYYLRRYVSFFKSLLQEQDKQVSLSIEVSSWLSETAIALERVKPLLNGQPVDAAIRYETLEELGLAASRYREEVYAKTGYSGKELQPISGIIELLNDALTVIDHSIATNKNPNGLYNAYNLMSIDDGAVHIDTLYPMLEGQVAVLSTGAIDPEEAADVIEALFQSDIYRSDQESFMLYPDRELSGFLEKNQIPKDRITESPLLQSMLEHGDESIILKDEDGCFRFNADFTNAGDLSQELKQLDNRYQHQIDKEQDQLLALYEEVFNQKAFTGRSGGMFGFEGLGCIYWHMVSKLLLAVQENYFTAIEQDKPMETQNRLGHLYYKVRHGLGFNKTPIEFGAFPTDPYSHTPKHAGARQPGMTGQVKEEILTRFGELGICIRNGAIYFIPSLLRKQEFSESTQTFKYLDVNSEWQTITLPENSLAFTWCQVPVVYTLKSGASTAVSWVTVNNKQHEVANHIIPARDSSELFSRNGNIRQITVMIEESMLFKTDF